VGPAHLSKRTCFHMIRSENQQRFRFMILTGAAIALAASLGGCGFFESGNQTHQAALEKQNSGFERVSLYDAVAISLQRNLDAPPSPVVSAEAPLLQAWEKIDGSLTGLNPDHATRNKTAEQIIATTRSTYLRAVAATYLQDRVEDGLARLQGALKDSTLDAEELADRQDQIREIQTAYAPFASARQELAALLGIENPNVLMLDDLPEAALGPGSKDSLEMLERNALANRLEFEILGVPSQDEMEALLKEAETALPPVGPAEEMAQPESQWLSFTDQFGDGLARILNMKLALENPETRERFDRLRTQAVTTAIVAQVRLAHAQLQKSEQDALRAVSENNTGTLVGTLRAELARHNAMIAMQDAQGLLKRSVGVAPVPLETGRLKLAALSAALQQRDRLPVPDTVMVSENRDYQHPGLTPVAFHPVDLMGQIPLARKIAVEEGAETSIFHRFGSNPRTLKISAGRVRALLEAPIIEP